MARAFQMGPLVGTQGHTARLGAKGAGYTAPKDLNKAVKLAADSQYNICEADDAFEGIILSIEPHTSGGFIIGSVQLDGYLEAKVATGVTLAVGDYVNAADQPAVGTATDYPIVGKAATTPAIGWRVVSLGSAGTGAAGTVVVIQKV